MCSFYFLFSCSKEKEVKILGYAYNNDRIIVSIEGNVLFDKSIYGTIDKENLCSFYEPKIKISSSDIQVNFKIDSSGVSVLDTVITISSKIKAPFVSFIHPSKKSKHKRKIFLGDDNDERFFKD
ncbi:Uncharacterised protein [Flavobacterium hibernum]|nr:hypothetical protein DBR27_12260 [Flavobacterium sp. HMWF030]STO15361.1 Uncharacterised protein [Flavobacterium hibernum]